MSVIVAVTHAQNGVDCARRVVVAYNPTSQESASGLPAEGIIASYGHRISGK
jgi:hypothetical protein